MSEPHTTYMQSFLDHVRDQEASTPAPRPRAFSEDVDVPTAQHLHATATANLNQANGTLFDTYEELLERVNDLAELAGFAVSVLRRANKDASIPEIAHLNYYTRHDLCCYRGRDESRGSTGTGYRSTGARPKTSTKSNHQCPWAAKAVYRKALQRWEFVIRETEHNHDMADNSSALPIHRKRKQKRAEFQAALEEYAVDSNMTALSIKEHLHRRFPDVYVKPRDIWNAQQIRRGDEYGLRSPFQQFLYILKEMEDIFVVIHRADPDNPDSKITGIFWTYEWLIELYKRNPEWLSVDATYTINKLGLPLFQIHGLTCLHTTFNVAFALLGGESEHDFAWVLDALKDVRKNAKIPPPQVVVSDYDIAFRNAAKKLLPTTKLHLCRWHILKNAVHHIKKKYNGSLEGTIIGDMHRHVGSTVNDPAGPDAPPPPPIDRDVSLENDELSARVARELLQEQDRRQHLGPNGSHAGRHPAVTPKRGYSKTPDRTFADDADGVLAAIQAMVYADTEAAFDETWDTMQKEFSSQELILIYWRTHYLSVREDYSQYAIKFYRNYGICVTSVSEGSHGTLKRMVPSRNIDLKVLYDKITQFCGRIRTRLREALGEQRTSDYYPLKGNKLFENIYNSVSHRALDLLLDQYNLAYAALEDNRSNAGCTGCFTIQYALPCWHKLYDFLQAGEVVQYWHLDDEHWSIDRNDPLPEELKRSLREHDPDPVRRQRHKNAAPLTTTQLRDTSSTSERRHDVPATPKTGGTQTGRVTKPRAKKPTKAQLAKELADLKAKQAEADQQELHALRADRAERLAIQQSLQMQGFIGTPGMGTPADIAMAPPPYPTMPSLAEDPWTAPPSGQRTINGLALAQSGPSGTGGPRTGTGRGRGGALHPGESIMEF